MTAYKILFTSCTLLAWSLAIHAQEPTPAAPDISGSKKTLEETEAERWNLYYQASSIGDYHGTFTAPYTGPLSLQNNPERDVSLHNPFLYDPSGAEHVSDL